MEPNVILIVCDTLRKDVLGLYNGEAKTPHLKKLAKDSVVYENAIAPAPWTFPSHVSMFTGMYSSVHGIHETETNRTADLIPLNKKLDARRLADFLKSTGYSTMGISNNIQVSRFTGFDIGFQSFF